MYVCAAYSITRSRESRGKMEFYVVGPMIPTYLLVIVRIILRPAPAFLAACVTRKNFRFVGFWTGKAIKLISYPQKRL